VWAELPIRLKGKTDESNMRKNDRFLPSRMRELAVIRRWRSGKQGVNAWGAEEKRDFPSTQLAKTSGKPIRSVRSESGFLDVWPILGSTSRAIS